MTKKTPVRVKADQVLVQTRVSRRTHALLEAKAAEEGISGAALTRQALEAYVNSRSLAKRVRALEVAMLAFGVVPEGVTQLSEEEEEACAVMKSDLDA